MQLLLANIDTVVVATADGPAIPESGITSAGARWDVAPGVTIELGTPNTHKVSDDKGRPLPFRTTLGPEVLWHASLEAIEARAPWLAGGRLMQVHVCRDWYARDPYTQLPGEDFSADLRPFSPYLHAGVAQLLRCRTAWLAGRPARLSALLNGRPSEGATLYRGRREKAISCVVYHKTARHKTCDRLVPVYSDAWAAHGWPAGHLMCSLCRTLAPCSGLTLYADHCRARVDGQTIRGVWMFPPVMRQETRWPSRYLRGRRWSDLRFALGWPAEVAAWDKTPLRYESNRYAQFEPPRQRRSAKLLTGLLKHHQDMRLHHDERAAWLLTMGVRPPDDPLPVGQALARAAAENHRLSLSVDACKAILDRYHNRERWPLDPGARRGMRVILRELAQALGRHRSEGDGPGEEV